MQSRYHDVGGRTITLVAVTSLPRDPWGEEDRSVFFSSPGNKLSKPLSHASLAFDVLHHDESMPSCSPTCSADVGVVELTSLEAGGPLGGRGQVRVFFFARKQALEAIVS